MKITTHVLGEVEFSPRQIFTFPEGLYAFDEMRSFVLLDSAQPSFYWLQSMEKKDLAFLMVQPGLFVEDYSIEGADPSDLRNIGLQGVDDPNGLSFSIVTLHQDTPTLNLKGPILLNKESKLGCQLLLNDDRWSVRHMLRILKEVSLE